MGYSLMGSTFIPLQLPPDGHLDPDTFRKITEARQNVNLVLSHMRLLISGKSKTISRELPPSDVEEWNLIYNCIRHYSEQTLSQWHDTYSDYTAVLRQLQQAGMHSSQVHHQQQRVTSGARTSGRSVYGSVNSRASVLGLPTFSRHDTGKGYNTNDSRPLLTDRPLFESIPDDHPPFHREYQSSLPSDTPPPLPEKPARHSRPASLQLSSRSTAQPHSDSFSESPKPRPMSWQEIPETKGALLKAVKRLSQTEGGFTEEYLRALDRVTRQVQDSPLIGASQAPLIQAPSAQGIQFETPDIGPTITPQLQASQPSQTKMRIPRIRPPSRDASGTPTPQTLAFNVLTGVSVIDSTSGKDVVGVSDDSGYGKDGEATEVESSLFSPKPNKSPSTSTFGPQKTAQPVAQSQAAFLDTSQSSPQPNPVSTVGTISKTLADTSTTSKEITTVQESPNAPTPERHSRKPSNDSASGETPAVPPKSPARSPASAHTSRIPRAYTYPTVSNAPLAQTPSTFSTFSQGHDNLRKSQIQAQGVPTGLAVVPEIASLSNGSAASATSTGSTSPSRTYGRVMPQTQAEAQARSHTLPQTQSPKEDILTQPEHQEKSSLGTPLKHIAALPEIPSTSPFHLTSDVSNLSHADSNVEDQSFSTKIILAARALDGGGETPLMEVESAREGSRVPFTTPIEVDGDNVSNGKQMTPVKAGAQGSGTNAVTATGSGVMGSGSLATLSSGTSGGYQTPDASPIKGRVGAGVSWARVWGGK